MAWGPVERWLEKGWSLPRVLWAVVAGATTLVAGIGYLRTPHHPGAVWWVITGLAVIIVWLVSEVVRWRWRHNRLEQRLEVHSRSPEPPGPPARSTSPRLGVGNVFADEPDLLERSDKTSYARPAAETVPPLTDPVSQTEARIGRANRDVLEKSVRKRPPDFSPELEIFSQLDLEYDASDEGADAIEDWIDSVHTKLEQWNPRQAKRFVTAGIADSVRGAGFVLGGRSDVAHDPELLRLHTHRQRLKEITGQ